MKKYSTNYWTWTGWFVSYSSLLIVLSYAGYAGLTYHKKYSMDTEGYALALVSLAGIALTVWELITLFDFLIRGVTGDIFLTDTDLTIAVKGGQESFKFSDIESVEFVNPRFWTRSVIGEVSHCKLTFKERTIFLTSFTIKNDEIAQHLKVKVSSVSNRDRRFFELMK